MLLNSENAIKGDIGEEVEHIGVVGNLPMGPATTAILDKDTDRRAGCVFRTDRE